MRLLIVEDDAIIARDLAESVADLGHHVVGCVDSGEMAIATAIAAQPDLMLMDIRLRGAIDGIAAAAVIREQCPIAVVFLTAYSDSDTVRRAAAVAPAGYLRKPFDERDLRSALEIAVARQQLELDLRSVNAQLATSVIELERRAFELTILGELGEKLLRCHSLEEGYAVVAHAAHQLFPATSGVFYVRRQNATAIVPLLTWGSLSTPAARIDPQECRAIQEAQVYYGGDAPIACLHCIVGNPLGDHVVLCVPLLLDDDAYGVLHIKLTPPDTASELISTADSARRLARTLAKQAALGLANVRLRAELHDQAIRDSLTGLFNRRYLEETLARELHRAVRDRYPVGVIMLDVDHFKQINDTYGHDAGDVVLRSIGQQLLASVRAGDIVCRYGGEEFVLILPAVTLDVVTGRAEIIRQSIGSTPITFQGGILPVVTVSMGVTIVADSQASVSDALTRADTALYAAKHAGRNQVVTLEP